MQRHWLGAALALAAAMIAHNVGAQVINSCPAGQVVQGSDASGRYINCVPLPDVSGLQAQIEAEKAAREGMDVVLQDAIDELRPTEISGTYSFTGVQTCMNSTFGFNPDLTPVPSPDPNRGAVITQNSSVATGFRTFNEDGSGTSQIRTVSMVFPGMFYGSGFTGVTSAGVTPGGVVIPGGNGSIVEQSGTFSWRIEGNLLIIEDEPAPGVFTAGNRTGWSIVVTGAPRQVGVLGKDRRLIHVSNDAFAVETNVITSPPAVQPPQTFTTPRICLRERLLRKM